MVQNMACSKAAVMQAAVSLPESKCTSVSSLCRNLGVYYYLPFQILPLDLLGLTLPHCHELSETCILRTAGGFLPNNVNRAMKLLMNQI